MSRKIRAPFAYNRLALLCLMALPASQALALTVVDGGKQETVMDGGSDPFLIKDAGSRLETGASFLDFSTGENGVATASVTNSGTLVINKNAKFTNSGDGADTISLDNGTLDASGNAGITYSGTDAWGINAQNGSTIIVNNAQVISSGAGSILLGNNSSLTADTLTVTSALNAAGIQLNADSTSKAKAILRNGSFITSQDNDAISVTNGEVEISDSGVNASRDNANAINAVSGAKIISTGNSISTAGSNGSAVLLGETNTSLTSTNTKYKTTGSNAHAINVKAGIAELTGDTVTTSGSGSHGLSSSGGTIAGSGVTVNIEGEGGVGAYATTKGDVTLTGASKVTTTVGNATGLFADTNGTVKAASTTVLTKGNNSIAAKADGGTVTLSEATSLTTSSASSKGIYSTNAGAVDATGVKVTIDGSNSVAVSADQSGNIILSDSAINTTTTGGGGIFSSTSSTIKATNTTVDTLGDWSTGVSANAAKVELIASPVITAGANSAGIYSGNAGQVTATDSDITTSGEGSYALSVDQGSISVTNATLKTGNAAGIFATIGGDTYIQAGDVTLNTVTVDAAQSSILAQDAMLNVTAKDTTFNSGTGLVLDVQADPADPSTNSAVKLNADNSILNGSLVSNSTQNTSNVLLSNNSILTGYSQNISSIELDSTSNWNLTANSDVQSLTNNGTITFSAPTSGDYKTLTVNGNYAGNGGTLVMNSLLSDDNSPTDKLIVTGNVEAGDTRVAINELGGTGAYTVNGIEVVSVGGVSEGTFTKSGRIVAGAYDYDLEKINQSWYLTNKAPEVTDPGVTDPGVTDPGVTDPGVTDPGVTPPGVTDPEPGPDGVSQYRPETGSYLANMLAANTMFDHRMQDRLGEGGYARSAEGAHADGLWMRHVGSHNRFYDESGQLKARTNRYVLQLGVDLAEWSSDGYDRWHVGVMGGYGNAQSNIRSGITGYRADSKVEGYSAGVYATWVESEKDMSGAYVDSWVLYNWFRNTINGEALATEKYDSKGFTASLEAGYTVPMTQGERVSSWLQPKVQLTWMDVGADNHREHNGTWVTDDTDGMLRSRVGVRAYLKGHSELDNNTGRDFQPFVEANWLHNFNDYSVKMDDVTNSIAGDKNVGELKLGVEGKIANDFTMWGNVAQQVGSAGYSDTTVMFGARVNF